MTIRNKSGYTDRAKRVGSEVTYYQAQVPGRIKERETRDAMVGTAEV